MTRRLFNALALPGAIAISLFQGEYCPVLAETTGARIVELVADKDNRWKLPGGQKTVELKSGETVTFRITSYFGGQKAHDGAVHSFVVRKLKEKGWSVRLKEGIQEITLVAPSAGKYLIECTVECGPGHDNMNIPMIVAK